MPLEASSVIGAIGGITEIAREAFGKPRPPAGNGNGSGRDAGGPWGGGTPAGV